MILDMLMICAASGVDKVKPNSNTDLSLATMLKPHQARTRAFSLVMKDISLISLQYSYSYK